MDGGGDRRSNEERGAEKHMDEYLRSIGLHRKKIAKDGSCLFRAVAEQVLHCQSLHTQVRSQCVEFLRKNRENYEAFIEGDFEEYLYKLRDPQQWVGEVEINALAMMYKRDFWIYQEPGKAAVNITDKNFKDRVQLCFLNGNHYDCVYPLSHIKNSAMCQSILYELLYEKVCGVDRSLLGGCQRNPKPSDALIDDCLPPCPSSEESDSEDAHRQENGTCASVVKSKGRGRGRYLSDRVRRSLNPTLLRNVQFDQWLNSKKAQQKMDFCIAAGMQYNVGDRCQVHVDACGKVVNATVKKLSPYDNGPVTVYNDNLGEIEVPLWKLRPPSETSWSTVVREKKVTNGHGEWEDRGRGRGRGKPSFPPGAPQASAPPAGRISKQHSWPPQAAADEREAPSRKSESVSFGLTMEQRLAREEEKRNAALVELQFPDDRSFPALGTQSGGQGEGGKKRGGEKRRSQKNSRKSPVEEVRAASPSSFTDDSPLPSLSTSAPSAPPSNPPSSVSPPAPKPSTLSYACAATPVCSSPPQSGMVPSTASHFSFMTPVLPAASTTSSSTSSAPSSFPRASSPPTFIAPIAPSPAVAQSRIGRTTPSPPVPALTHSPPGVTEAPVQTATATSHLSTTTAPRSEVPEHHNSSSDLPLQNQVPNKVQNQVQTPVPQTQTAPPPVQPTPSQIQTPPQTEPVHFLEPPLPSQVPFPSAALQTPAPSHPQPLPQNEPAVPAPLPNHDPTPPPASQPQMEPPNLGAPLSQDPPALPSPDQPPPQPPTHLHYPTIAPHAFPLHQQLSLFCQDPLYPGFPLGDKGQVVPIPSMSTNQSGDDLPQEMNILRFFFNLGVKAFSYPMHAPVIYLFPLQQAHSLQPRALSRSPSPVYHQPPPPAPAAVTPQDAYPPYNPSQPSPPAPPATGHTPHPVPHGLPASYNPNQSTQEASLYDRANQQATPNMFNPAHSTPQAPPSTHDHAHNMQAPPNPEPPLSSYNRSTPQIPPAAFDQPKLQPPPNAYSPSHPPPADPRPPHDTPYPQPYPQHVHWQPPQAGQVYPISYPYNQGYYHHQGPVEQPQPTNGDTPLGLRAARLPGAMEGSASPNMGNVNGGQMPMLPGVASFGHSNQDVGENMMLLVDPPLDKPIVINVPKSSSGPGSPALYSPAHSSDSSNMASYYIPHHKSSHHTPSYRSTNPSAPAFIPTNHSAPFLQMPELMSVSVGTEEDWDEPEEARVPFRGQRRGGGGGYRGRGRGQYRPRGHSNQYHNHRSRGRY